MLDFTLIAPDDFTIFDVFTGRADNDSLDCCDRPALDQPLLSVHDSSSAPEYICHLACYLYAAHCANVADDR